MVELFDAIGKVKLLIIDPGNNEQNCQIIRNMLHRNLISGNNDPAEVYKLLQIKLFRQHEAFPSLHNVQDLCSREIAPVLPRIDRIRQLFNCFRVQQVCQKQYLIRITPWLC